MNHRDLWRFTEITMVAPHGSVCGWKEMVTCHLSHDAAWTFRDERIIGLVNAIYQGIFVYILADVA